MKMEATGNASDSTLSDGRTYIFPTTFAQQRLWFLEQLQPEGTSYLVPWSLRVTGKLNVEALDRGLNEVVRRHEILRTTFSWKDGFPVQVVHESVTIPLRFLNLSNRSDAEAESQKLALEEANTPLNLERGPLVRARLLQLAPEEHVLLLTVHHIIFDGWSRRILVSELSALYEAFSAGRPSPLSPPKLQYPDYAVWQRKQFQGARLDKDLSYWRRQLAGAPSSLELPTDRPRPPVQTFRGARLPFAINKELMDSLKEISRAQGTTLFMTLLAGFQALLSRYSNQDDVLVGTPIASRNRAELEEMIGFFANTLVIRTRFSEGPSFRQLLGQVREATLGAYEHQDLPFEKLVEELQPQRDLSQNPLFQVMFSLQNQPRPDFELPGLKLRFMSMGDASAKFDISAFLSETPDGISGRIEYNIDLFDKPTVERMLVHYRALLERAVQAPDKPMSRLAMLTDAEHSEILSGWNSIEAEYPRGACLHNLIEQQADRTPDAVACLQAGDRPEHDRRLSYRELNAQANQLARALRRRGVGRGERVGICVERSLEMMIGLLGIQKAGAAYVPLDPDYPAERIRFILDDGQPKVLITQSSLLPQLPLAECGMLLLDADWPEVAEESEANLENPQTSDDIAYVIFTFGSTGRGKGVQIRQRSVVNLLTFMAKELQVGPQDVFPALASFASDMCIPELYLALIAGGCVVIGKRHLAANGEELSELLQRSGATIVHATPTTWNLLLEAGFTGQGLKRVIGADPMSRELCQRLLEADKSLYSFYGPTETTVWSAFHHFRSQQEPVVVGRPLANTQIYILDKNLQPVPIGVPGEIHIGGEGVAAGYLNRPELTSEKFIPDPFSKRPGATLYKTGDLGRFLPDGRIEFRGDLSRQILDKQLAYWKRTLAGSPASLDLPTDRTRPAQQSSRCAKQTVTLSSELSRQVEALGRQQGATLFMTLLAAFNVLLARYSGQDDIVVGSPIAGRTRPELEKLPGLFVNTLVMRTRVSGNPTFRQLLAQVRETAMGAYAHQDVPFEKLVEELKPERDLSRNPLFQVMFILQNVPPVTNSMAGVEISGFPLPGESSKFDQTLIAADGVDGLRLTVEYNSDLFDGATIEEMVRHFRVLLEAATENPDTHIADLPLLTEAERQEILVVWNATHAEYPRNLCVHELIERQTERAPDATAIVMGEEVITYRELNERANQLAHYLIQHGAGPEVLIGIYLERSINMIVALLAVLKSGAAYVPLDPAYPAERIAFVLEDAGISLLLTQSELLNSLPASSSITIDMQTISGELAQEDRRVPQSQARPEDLAYVLYTSGSTGKPKGVQITNANLVNLLVSMQREPGLRAIDSLLGVTTLSFDIAGLEIYLPLVTGARLILASRTEASDGRALLDLMQRHQATVMQATPATWRMLLEAGWKGSPELRILCGGEALPGDLALQLLPRCAQLWNMYGPTETTIWSSVYRVQSAAATLPIGRPIANTTFYILDPEMRPVPTGVAGELFIGGEGVARGYLRRPELTASRFLPDPFAGRPDARLYRTGDIARYLRDGNVQYLGRSDFQVKIRGFRIELGEIESALSKHPSVQECVAVTLEDGPGDTRLVAYAVPCPGFRIAAAELLTWVKETLPSYMVPSAIVELDALPLTPNGKVDRKNLPKPGATVSTATDSVPARDEIELALTKIWQEVLNISTVGIRDNFFDLGGHSLLAVRLTAEIKEKIGRDIPLTALFQGATVEYLAEVIRGKAAVATAVIHNIQPLGDRPPFFAAVVAGVNALGYVPLAKHLGTAQPLYALQRSGPGPMALRRPLTQQEYEEIATEYIQAMRTVQPEGPYHLGGFCEGAQIAFEMTRQLELQGEQVRLLAIFDTWVVENTQNRRLWRFYYYTQRLRQLRRLPLGSIVAAVRRAARNRIQWFLRMKSAPPKSAWRQIYWPAPDFVPKSINTRITVFKVPQQPYYYRPDPFLGWGPRSSSGIDVQVVPDGRHRLLLREPHVRNLAEVLWQVLDQYNPPPLVSVIIPAYRCAQYIAQALDSVLAQSYTNCEILVVNDGSPDTTELEAALQPYQDKIRYIKQPNRGPAAARNQGILESQGKYIAFLDADDYWGSDHLAKQMAQFQQDPSLELAYCDSVLIKGSVPLERAFAIQPQAPNVTFDSLLVEDCAIATSTTVVSREAIMRAGGFDENFLRCEDFEMWLRLAFAGTRMAYHPDPDVFHRLSETSLSADRWSMKKDRIRVYQKVVESLPVSNEQRRVVQRLVADIETACDVDLLKHFLHRGEYPRAREAAQRANARGSGWKVRAAGMGLRLTPGLFRQFFRARAWFLRIRKHPKAATAGTLPSHADSP